MIRVFLLNLLLFVAPFIVVWLWMQFISAKQPDATTRKIYAVAAVIGLVLVATSLIVYRTNTANAPEGNYVPPQYKDGQISPGRFE